MAREIKPFNMFGVHYTSRQFSAVDGLSMMSEIQSVPPEELLKCTDVLAHPEDHPEGIWLPLTAANINLYVVDRAKVIAPVQVLALLSEVVIDWNFGFLKDWTGVKIPSRFVEDIKSVKTAHSPSVVASLVANGSASMRELEEYYSTQDAFKMIDIMTAKSVNEALASEASHNRIKKG
ncbi:hypothetical protein debbie_41 [Pseudomonas phage debbie]|uniref:Uncharacterized protein n=1 Tax=Pseudomonas phage debbie TaxID=2719602 RepID=A0A6G9LLL6_9CAUD|nr:hypothetical protein debbie_41 [Pseudomonas phage debbie]UXD82270.1 hypothetical protein NP274_00035 [Pseudomonas phage Kara-mokiny kep-wari Wadjak 8]